MNNSLRILAVPLLLLAVGCEAGSTGTEPCRLKVYNISQGVSVLALEDFGCAYPVFASTFKAEFDLAFKTKQSIVEANAGGELGTQVVELFEKLDQINLDVQNQLKTAYLGYITTLSVATSPDERRRAAEAFEATQNKIIALVPELRKLTQQLQSAVTDNSDLETQEAIQQAEVLGTRAKEAGFTQG